MKSDCVDTPELLAIVWLECGSYGKIFRGGKSFPPRLCRMDIHARRGPFNIVGTEDTERYAPRGRY